MLEVKTKVLISGGGPVGLTLALELSRQGVECLIVNEQETTSIQNGCLARTFRKDFICIITGTPENT